MENIHFILNINSIYILKNIFNYIKDNNFQLKLFKYSKHFQNKLNLKVFYQEKYLKKIRFNISNYLHTEEYNKDYLNKKYEEFLSKNAFNKNEFENIIYNILANIDNIDKNFEKFDQ